MEKRTRSFACLLLSAAMGLAASASAQDACQAPDPVQHEIGSTEHVPNCSQLSFSHYPPTSGSHYPAWANFKTFKFAVNPGYYLHSLEHGAIVILINCQKPGDCDGDFARLQRIADAAPQDSLCDSLTRHRIVIAQDTVMQSRFAAVAWGWSLESDCIDSAAFDAFIKAHYAQGPENVCAAGANFSGEGWCNAPSDLEPKRSLAEITSGAAGGSRVLWRGTLAERGRLTVETASVTGRLLERRDLGQAGPGPARAVWDPSMGRGGSTASGPVVNRVLFESASGIRTLSESIAPR